MSIFGKIMSGIFGSSTATAAPVGGTTAGATPAGGSSSAAAAAPAGGTTAGATPAGGSSSAAVAPAAAPAQTVDVAPILDKAVAAKKEKLEWRTSIVDLMKLLGLDSSIQHRKELASELGYKGDTNDSATMNIWLHRQVMTQLAANGGKVPADLRN